MKKQGVVEDVPTVPPKDLMTYAVKKYRKLYRDLLRQGFPEPIADKIAQEEVLKWVTDYQSAIFVMNELDMMWEYHYSQLGVMCVKHTSSNLNVS